MKTQFVTNSKGKKIAAVIPIKEYEDLLEDISSAAVIERRRHEVTVSWEEVKQRLIRDGILPG